MQMVQQAEDRDWVQVEQGTHHACALLLLTGVRLSTAGSAACSASDETTNILIAGERVIALGLEPAALAAVMAVPGCCPLDGKGLLAVPGFIDIHVHVAGGGGEASFCSRTPEAQLSQLINAGITTLVGITGTDCVSRSQENLLAKVHALREDGLTAYSWCGSYRLPPATATGSVQREICLLDCCLGVGEVAVSDHRGSVPTPHQLATLASEARVAGMLAGKAGLVHCHMGPGTALLQPLRDAVAASCGDVPLTQFHPTHIGRSQALIRDGARWLAEGGTLDLTCDNIEVCCSALELYRSRGLPLSSVTVSTDAYGSLPEFDAQGKLVGYSVASPDAMLTFLRHMCLDKGWALADVLPLMTSNPAAVLKLQRKGGIAVGQDADVLLLEPGGLQLRYVIARGAVLKTPEWVRGGMFERGPGIRPRRPGEGMP